MTTVASGFLLGLAMIVPIGAQNVFVINQAVAVGLPRALIAVAAAGICDTLLILAGALGVSALLDQVPGLRPTLLAAGALFLLYLAVQSFRTQPAPPDNDSRHEPPHDPGNAERAESGTALPVATIATRTATVSLLNPHAILDTVGVLGAAIAAQAAPVRNLFAIGTISASWVWFGVLALAGAAARHALTPTRRVLVDRISGLILLAFAVFLTTELIAAIDG